VNFEIHVLQITRACISCFLKTT